jgi:hypothetical protein
VPLLIRCQACKKEVSKSGEACANCSHPIADSVDAYVEERRRQEELARIPAEEEDLLVPIQDLGDEKVELRLFAYGPIERLILSDDGAKPPQKKYYEQISLKAGWEESFSINGSFRCYASSLENIRYHVYDIDGHLIHDGQNLVPPKNGPGYFVWSEQEK